MTDSDKILTSGVTCDCMYAVHSSQIPGAAEEF